MNQPQIKTVLLECSNCRAKLVNVLCNENKKMSNGQDFMWKVRAKCCYCPDYSFNTDIKGIFYHAGYSEPSRENPENPDYNVPKVDVVDIQTEPDLITFLTKKR